MSERAHRKLAAIVAADVADYSRLVGADEEGTLRSLRGHRDELIDLLVSKHRGRIANTAGDSLLMEFPSVVDAVRCSIEFQRGIDERNIGVAQAKRIFFRIGINIGDVVAHEGDLLGDGVNVAARLESICDPGGIVISDDAYRQVRDRLDFKWQDYGKHKAKNITRPIQVWRWIARDQSTVSSSTKSQKIAPPIGKISIAVLPFLNLSGDQKQEYFSDGITEDITTELSRYSSLFVVARNAAFKFRESEKDFLEVGEALGAQYLLDGSFRKAGKRARVTVQLINAQTGENLWAERYDRDLIDIFEVQDDVVRRIASTIPGLLDRLTVHELRRKPPENLSAYEFELRARWAYLHLSEGLQESLALYELAVEADPNYAQAQAGLGMVSAFSAFGLGAESEEALARGKSHIQKALALEPRNPTVIICAAFTFHLAGEFQLATRYGNQAVQLNPNDPLAHYVKACALSYAGELESALLSFESSENLEPYSPDDQRLDTLCDCYYMLGEYGKVIEIHKSYQDVPAFLYLVLAAAQAQLGNAKEAKAAVAAYESARPIGHDPVSMFKLQMQMCARQEDRDHWREGYLKAGFRI